MTAADAIHQLPKAELHVHVEGTLEPETVLALAHRNGVDVGYPDAAALAAAHRFGDLRSFLDLYYRCTSVLRRAEDFRDLADAYLARARAEGVVRAEIFFDPQAHTSRGVPLGEVVEGLAGAVAAAEEHHGLSAGLIACFLRDAGPDEAMRTLDELAPHAHRLLGVGLDSAEVGYPPSLFARVFEEAGSLGLHRVAHAGEEGPPEYVWQALDVLGVERVDHGIRSVEDRALLRRLATDRVPLTVCPLSNVRLCCVPSMAEHPLPVLLDAGVVATLSSDDPAYFGGYVSANYQAVADALGLDEAALARLAAASLDAAFTG